MKTLTRAQLNEWLERLAAQQELVAPRRESQGLFYRVVHHPNEIAWDGERPTLSAKEFLFLPSERLLKVEKRGPDVRLERMGEPTPQVLFGLRPCDARGIRIQDAAFLETPPADRAYALRREKTTTVGLACRSMGPSCFCTAMGLGPDDARDVDLMLTDLGESVAVQAMNARGEALLTGLALQELAGDPPPIARRETIPPPDGEAWAASYGDARWQEFGERCLSCRLCGYVCPTCRCYDVRDESLASPPGEAHYERLRAWDTCTREGYRLTAGGHNPRAASGSRLRNRLLCKFLYYPHQYGPTACTGCGRCIDVCPVSLDLLEIGGALQEATL
jgi:ferredoxin